MAFEITRVAVLGAGVMGSGIAAHLANAGLPVLLLDVAASGDDRAARPRAAVARLRAASPSPFLDDEAAGRVQVGTLEDDLAAAAECDWIVEAVVEDLAAKQALYARLEPLRRPTTIVTSNTSTIPLAQLVAGRGDAFAAHFAITHFFNPPRWMRLLELVGGPATRPEVLEALETVADRRLGKTVVRCHDTPGFIANRIGTFWMHVAVQAALDGGLTVEEADAVCGRPMGIPKTGIFGLLDLVGLDLMPHVEGSLVSNLPATDRYRTTHRDLAIVRDLVASGRTGRKGGAGFYRVTKAPDGTRTTDVVDLATGEYRPMRPASLDSVRAAKGGVGGLVSHPDRGGTCAWRVLSQTLVYACEVAPAIADGIADVDEAMRLGFNWAQGPFELLDAIGAARVAERWQADGGVVPPLLAAIVAAGSVYRVHDGRRQALGFDGTWRDVERADGVLLLADVRLRQRPERRNGSASVWDLGDGVLGVEVHTKMNALDADVMAMLDAARAMAEATSGDGGALVVYNEGAHFSVGANLALLLYGANLAAWRDIEKLVAAGQSTFAALATAPVPVVAAVHGMALGGGCELALHSHVIVAHVEAQFGLVETGVGLVPAWGGCAALLRRLVARTPDDPMAAIARAMELIGKAAVAPHAVAARTMGFLRDEDRIVMHRDRLLAEAKGVALARRGLPRSAAPAPLALPGAAAREAIGAAVGAMVEAGQATAHDAVVASALAEVLTGGDLAPSRAVRTADLHALERAAFVRLLHEPKTLARLEAMLATGTPLRN